MSLSPQLLAELAAAGLGISQHRHTPRSDEWFAGGVDSDGLPYGDVGPYESAEAALVGGVAWLVRIEEAADRERLEALDALMAAREEVEALKVALQAAQAELRAEREAKGSGANDTK